MLLSLGSTGLLVATAAVGCSGEDTPDRGGVGGTQPSGAGMGGGGGQPLPAGGSVPSAGAPQASAGGSSGAGTQASAGQLSGASAGGSASGAGASGRAGNANGGGGRAVSAGVAGVAAAGASGASGGPPVGERTPESVCARWNADRANVSEGTWSGNVASCDAGDISVEGRANALRLFNLYRWLADLPPVVTEASRDRQAQACALLMEANDSLSHSPPMTWQCWTQEGADGAGSSNISTGPGVQSADGYMIDNGNATTIGHRRWILSNSLGPIGLGSTATGASCMQNLRGTGRAGKPWLAYPPPGPFPIEAFRPGRARTTLDATGWTVQSDSIVLANAVVTVTSGGMALPVTVTQLLGGYGSRHALRFNPSGWETQAGQTYGVAVTGIATEIRYEVQVVDCTP